jgi:hypothetical protein
MFNTPLEMYHSVRPGSGEQVDLSACKQDSQTHQKQPAAKVAFSVIALEIVV